MKSVPTRAARLRLPLDPADAPQVIPSRWTLLFLISILGAACTTSHELVPVNRNEAVIQRLDPQCAWRVVDGGTLHGFVVRFVDRQIATRCTYSVRNELQQELGTIDELGRAWRFVPHQREAQWVCTSTLKNGVAQLLGTGPGTSLEEVDLDLLRAPSGG